MGLMSIALTLQNTARSIGLPEKGGHPVCRCCSIKVRHLFFLFYRILKTLSLSLALSLSGASVNNRSEKGQTPYDYALACRNDIAEMLKPDAPSPRPITPRATSLSNPQPQSPATPSMGTSLSALNGSSPSPASLRLSPRAHNQIHIDDFLTEDGIMNWLERNGLGVYKQVAIRKTFFS